MSETTPPLDPGLSWRRPVIRGFVVVAVTFGGFGAWSAVAPLDGAAMAVGTITVESDRKAVQHLEGGIVAEIPVTNGAHVEQGQVLLRLDLAASQAGRDSARTLWLAALADEARLQAVVAGAEAIVFPAELRDEKDIVDAQNKQFREQRAAVAAERAVLAEKIAQTRYQMDGNRLQRDAGHAQLASLDTEMAKIKPLVDKGIIAGQRMLELERLRTDQKARNDVLDTELARMERVVAEQTVQRDQVERRAVDESTLRLKDVRNRLAELRQRLEVTDDQVARSELRAPRAGRIVNLKIHTVGAVVRPGETIMEIVPDDDSLVVTARLSPLEVTHVWPGLSAEVRLPAFKARETPLAMGHVTAVSADAMVDEASRQTYYELKVSVNTTGFPRELRSKLVPGMPAEVLVATGQRTLLQYLTGPLADAVRRGLRES